MRYKAGFCANGHDLDEHGITSPNSRRKCRTCANENLRLARLGVVRFRPCDNCQAPMPVGKNKGFCSDCIQDRADLARLRFYKLDRFQFNAMYFEQDGVCAICHVNEATHVDHDHSCCPTQMTCGRCVRALLCAGCNKGLGHFSDSPILLRGAADYIEDYL